MSDISRWSRCSTISLALPPSTRRRNSALRVGLTYSSVAELDVEDITMKVTFVSQCGTQGHTSGRRPHRSDSVISSTVSQVSNPSSTKLWRYCARPNRDSTGPSSVIYTASAWHTKYANESGSCIRYEAPRARSALVRKRRDRLSHGLSVV